MQTRSLNFSNAEASGIIWIVGGVWYLLCESVAAFGYPGYSYQHNYISDLGVPGAALMHGKNLISNLPDVMNAGFAGQGLAFILAAILLYSSSSALRGRVTFLAISIAHGFGITLAALVHGSDPIFISHFGVIHVVGAFLAIVGGNVVLILLGRRVMLNLVPPAVRNTAALLGVIGLISLVLLSLKPLHLPLFFDDGYWERGSVYSIIIGEIVAGSALIVTSRKQPTT
jgi:hypothetical membrane protein